MKATVASATEHGGQVCSYYVNLLLIWSNSRERERDRERERERLPSELGAARCQRGGQARCHASDVHFDGSRKIMFNQTCVVLSFTDLQCPYHIYTISHVSPAREAIGSLGTMAHHSSCVLNCAGTAREPPTQRRLWPLELLDISDPESMAEVHALLNDSNNSLKPTEAVLADRSSIMFISFDFSCIHTTYCTVYACCTCVLYS